MKKILAHIIHYFKPHYFENKSYRYLSKWGIKDVYNGKIWFD